MIAVEQEEERQLGRILGQRIGKEPGPTLLCIGSLHGNEPAGTLAFQRVFAKIEERGLEIRGELLGLLGNRTAFKAHRRFMVHDLNRYWLAHRIQASLAGELAGSSTPEDNELHELRLELTAAFERCRGRMHFLDLHTTSGGGQPFAVMSDTLRNRTFALQFPVPVIVGLEEELEGTLAEYLGRKGAVTMGFEGGQHEEASSVDLCEAAIWIALETSGVLPAGSVPEAEAGRRMLAMICKDLPRVFEIRLRHPIRNGDEFQMEPGFKSFQPVRKGQLLATDRFGEYRAHENGRILMPLYQKLGEDGYFEIRQFRPFWLRISRSLRKMRLDRVVHWLPGVRRHPDSADALIINRRVARFYSLQIFHLLGFRRHRTAGERLLMIRQQRDFPGE
ncbi:MAG: succinylglutamate desuccinylase/aspartoacylase family protein [Acidobacteria bacterium]|nr:succinylglutamate desuccinylase/aspartoacylase family protein [Acidobacteriota bacterium]